MSYTGEPVSTIFATAIRSRLSDTPREWPAVNPRFECIRTRDRGHRFWKFRSAAFLNAISWTECYLWTCTNFFCVFPPLLFLFVQQHSCLINEYDNDDNDDDDDDDDAVSVMWRVRGGWVSSSASAAILAKQVVYCFSGACPFVCVAFCLSAQKTENKIYIFIHQVMVTWREKTYIRKKNKQ